MGPACRETLSFPFLPFDVGPQGWGGYSRWQTPYWLQIKPEEAVSSTPGGFFWHLPHLTSERRSRRLVFYLHSGYPVHPPPADPL